LSNKRDDLVQRLATRTAGSARASSVFGEAVKRDGVTVIPVARARFGFGGGGRGGGGGARVTPLGYIQVDSSGAGFHPIVPPGRLLVVAAGAAAAGLALGFALRRRRR
jgi:uncharacterized spore protein YtfJ